MTGCAGGIYNAEEHMKKEAMPWRHHDFLLKS
nr:MAG TPA: hypothetical protein [Caudoviricetes sp.]